MARGRESTESEVDVVIIGGGPSGTMAATWLSRLGVSFRIVDKSAAPLECGHADGTQPRTLEVFESFGSDLLHKVHEHGFPISEVLRWVQEDGTMVLSARDIMTGTDISRLQGHTIHQGNIEGILREAVHDYGGPEVERRIVPSSLMISTSDIHDKNAYPVTLQLQHTKKNDSENEMTNGNGPKNSGIHRTHFAEDGATKSIHVPEAEIELQEVVHAKYVIGCDGAHSWTRQQLGFRMEGDRTDTVYGVIDVRPISNFPGIRAMNIAATSVGTLLMIPRENELVRYYVPLSEAKPDSQTGRIMQSQITLEAISKVIERAMKPYTWSYKYCEWWSVFHIGQRMSFRFNDDACRVFLAGDSVHTHSPKAGQGMNVSMMDTYNLGWKIAGVIKGHLSPEVLKTYEPERVTVAKDLIALDRRLSHLYDNGEPNIAELGELYKTNMKFTSGIAVHYGPSVIVAQSAIKRQHLASNIPLGERFPSYQVVNHASGTPTPLQQRLWADGVWRLVVFAGDMIEQKQKKRLDLVAERLSAPSGLLQRYQNSLLVLTVHCSNRDKFFLNDVHETFNPLNAEKGYDYDRLYADCETLNDVNCGKAYESYGVSKDRGCIVLTRPDQYTAWIGDLEDVEDLEAFVNGFMRAKA